MQLPTRNNQSEHAPPANAAAGDYADREYLDKKRGWLMMVATLFVNMAFQAMLNTPDRLWPRTKRGFGAPLVAWAPSPHVAHVRKGEADWRRQYLDF